ncbi:MAG: hypothetical protein COB78_06395 [Hyphomicrobiales bacterium]|nr:MAG: hypothetical protein COB78_06395 [Hyphomicrobiales bacterium]
MLFYKVFGRGSAAGSLKSGNGARASSGRLALVAALLGFVVFAISSLANPERALAIDCTGIPHHEVGVGNETFFFNGDTGTCATQTSGGVAPANGFRWYAHYLTFGASAPFYGTFGIWANCALTASSGPAAVGFQIIPGSCASGPALAKTVTSGTYDLEWTVTETVGQGGTSYVVKINVTTDLTFLSEKFTINSMSITGGVFDAPSVTISGVPANVDDVTPFNITMQFTETVTGFTLADIAVGNGVASNFVAVDGDTYTATITPTNTGHLTVTIAAGAAQDAAGLGNIAASATAVSIITSTQEVIATFMHNRAYHMLANQPQIGALLSGSNLRGGGPLGYLEVNGNEGDLRLSFASSLSRLQKKSGSDGRIDNAFPLESASSSNGEARNFDIWTEVYGSSSRIGDANSDFWVGYFGAHYFVSPDFILGALVQVDWASEHNEVANSSVEGRGWMIGPYIAGKIPGKRLTYEARIAWGRSDNDITPSGTYTDEFKTERVLASGKISGSYRMGSWNMKPAASIAWFEEQQEAYSDNLGNLIPKQTVSLGEFKFGPAFTYDILLDDGTLVQPGFGVSGVKNFGIKRGILTQGAVLGSDDLRARLDGGIAITNLLGWHLAFSGFYDGVGIDNYEAYGGSAKLVIPLN